MDPVVFVASDQALTDGVLRVGGLSKVEEEDPEAEAGVAADMGALYRLDYRIRGRREWQEAHSLLCRQWARRARAGSFSIDPTVGAMVRISTVGSRAYPHQVEVLLCRIGCA